MKILIILGILVLIYFTLKVEVKTNNNVANALLNLPVQIPLRDLVPLTGNPENQLIQISFTI